MDPDVAYSHALQVTDSVDRVSQELAKITNTLSHIARLLEDKPIWVVAK